MYIYIHIHIYIVDYNYNNIYIYMCYICESINIHTLLQVKAQHGATRIQTGHSTTNGKDGKYLSFDGMVLEDLAELEDLVDPTH